MQPRLRLFRLFGIQLTADWSWIFLLLMLAYGAVAVFTALLPRAAPWLVWLLALSATLLSVGSLYVHELAHALVAIRFGIPVRTISLFLLGGAAHITRESPSPRAELLIAMAGPATSLLIGALAAVVAALTRPTSPAIGSVALWLAVMNLPLAVFNMLPAFPLDGGRVLRAVLWSAGQDIRWGSTVAARAGQLGAVGLLFGGLYSLFGEPGGAVNGIWLVMVAWFMYAGATSAHRSALFTDALRRRNAASVMQRNVARVDAGVSLQSFAEDQILKAADSPVHPQAFAVYQDEHLVGLVDLQRIRRIPVALWGETSVGRVMEPIERVPKLEPAEPAMRVLYLLVEDGWDTVAVMAEGRLLGLVTRVDLLKAAADQR